MTEATHEAPPVKPLNGLMLIVAVVSAISGGLYGYDTGIISGALLVISKEFRTGPGMEQVIAGGILLGAVMGALACSVLSQRIGRHRTILLIAAVFVLGTLASSAAPTAVTLALARVLQGFAVGGATQTVPMYVAELAPARIRGRMVLCFQVAIGVGIVTATLVGASRSVSWRVEIGAAAVPTLVMLLLELPLPESPRWLVRHGRLNEAEKVLKDVRPDGYDISSEFKRSPTWRCSSSGPPSATKGGPGCGSAGCARPCWSAAASRSSPSCPASRWSSTMPRPS